MNLVIERLLLLPKELMNHIIYSIHKRFTKNILIHTGNVKLDIGGLKGLYTYKMIRNPLTYPPHLGDHDQPRSVDLLQFQVVAPMEVVALHFHCSQGGN